MSQSLALEDLPVGTKVKIPTRKTRLSEYHGNTSDFLRELAKKEYKHDFLVVVSHFLGKGAVLDFHNRTTDYHLCNTVFSPADLELYEEARPVIASVAGVNFVAEKEFPAFIGPDTIKPAHYNDDAITTFDVIKCWKLDFFLGNTIKYLQRRGRKGSELEDLEKAAAYLQEKISQLKAE